MTTRKRRGRGEGSIYQRGDGYWVATVSAGVDGKGKRRRKTVYGETKQEVQGKLRDAAIAIGNGVARVTDKLTLATFLDQWLAMKRTRVSPATLSRYRSICSAHLKPYLGSVRLDRLTV